MNVNKKEAYRFLLKVYEATAHGELHHRDWLKAKLLDFVEELEGMLEKGPTLQEMDPYPPWR